MDNSPSELASSAGGGRPQARDELRILVLAPISNDARLTGQFLEKAGLRPTICTDLADLSERLRASCGALLLAEEALASGALERLVAELEGQPSWSDLPLILITGSGEAARVRSRLLAALAPVGNISIIERPVRPGTLVSTCEVALRSRARQYQVRDLLKELEEIMIKVQQQARVFDTTLSSIPDFIYIFDRSGRFVYANRSFLELLGIGFEAVVGKSFLELPYPVELATRLDEQVRHVFQTGEILRDETSYTNPAGHTGYYEYIFTPVIGTDGQVEVVAGSTRDTSQRRRSEEALREADRRKDEFLAMLAHELRNPLAAVANAVALLDRLDSPNSDDHHWAVSVIKRQNQQLTHLIDDLLDVSRITTGKIRLRKELIDIATVLDHARDSAQPLIKDRGHEFVAEYNSDKLWIDADPARIEQVVLNLLTNAAKYTPSGGRIKLTAHRLGGEVLITVQDNGIGIAPHRLPEMFKLFAQGERSIARSEGGLGIGLTIVHKLVEMHGGRIEAHSEGSNLGSSFMVSFPAATAPHTPNEKEPSTDEEGKNLRVLIVDDNLDTAQTMAQLLRITGHKTELAHDGIQALERAREVSPQAVVLDIGLPGMDGFEVARRLRNEPCCANAVIIAVTGYGQPEDRQRALEAGCDHHLVKPVDLDELKRLIRSRSS